MFKKSFFIISILSSILLSYTNSASAASAPVVLFSDLTDGPVSSNASSGREGIQFGQGNWDKIGGNYYVYNNTIGQSDFGGECLMPQGESDLVEIKNNILMNSVKFYGGSFTTGTVVNANKNIYFGGAFDRLA